MSKQVPNDDRRKSDMVEAFLETSKINHLSTTQQIKLQVAKDSLYRLSMDQLQQSQIPQMVMKNYGHNNEDLANRMYDEDEEEEKNEILLL